VSEIGTDHALACLLSIINQKGLLGYAFGAYYSGKNMMKGNNSKKIRVRLLAALCLLIAPTLRGSALAIDPQKAITQYKLDSWTSENGLPEDTVETIVQTRDGYLWLGTPDGLARFDGTQFTVFNRGNTNEIKNDYVMALLEDREGSLWIGTFGGGLNRFKDGKFTVFTTKGGLSNDQVRSIYEDREGSLWIGTDGGGLNRFKDGKFTAFTTKDGLSNNRVRPICEDKEGSLWIGIFGAGLNRFKDGKFTAFTTKDGLSKNMVRSIYEDREGNLWIGTFGGGLNRFKDGKFTAFTTKDGLSNDSILSIYEDKEGSLWIGTDGGGLNRFKDGKFTAFTTKDGLSNDSVLSIYEDQEGSLWIGTFGGGVNRLKNGKFTVFTTKEGLSNDLVRPIYEDRGGNLWIGTDGGGLNRFKDGKFTVFTTKDGLSNDRLRSIGEDKEGSLWIGTFGGGLNRRKDGKFTVFTTKDGLSNDYVLAIYGDREGSLWVGTLGRGLNRFKDGKFTVFTTKDGLSNDLVRSIHEDREGNLWIGTLGGGLNRFKDGKFTAFTTREGLSNDSVLSIYEDQEGSLWIGTFGGGLNRFKDGKFTAFSTKDGLFNDSIYAILEDNQKNLWMSCSKGIFRVSKQELSDFAEAKISSISCTSYTTVDGLKTNECNGGSQYAGWKTRDGKLWFPTIKGVAVINPNNMGVNALAPPVVIEQVIIDGKQVSLTEGIKAPPGKGALEFHFTGLSLLIPEKVRFRYKLEGFDKDWIDAGTARMAHYTNLPPGVYRFKVVACNNDGLWNETGASLEFYLQPHFYQTYWFYGLSALAVMFLGFGLYRLRVRQLCRRTEDLEVIVDERTSELKTSQERVLKLEKQATEQQMAGGFAHELRNALAGSKLILDQALALDGLKPHVSLNLANCRGLKEIYVGLKGKLPEHDTQVVLGQMQTIFANEERLDEVMQLVRKATSRGLNITQQIMDYSKMGQQQPGQQSVDLHNLIVSIVNESREEFSSQGVVIEYKSEHQLLTVIGDETHFYSIIKNIILNARDALMDPSLKDRKDRRIEITTALEGGFACSVVIADNGIGIPQENLQKVFEPFFSTKPATGTGLGLGMVKKMVSLYNGSIDVRSEAGKGTTVTISLPLSQQAATL
jgi:ligand-binding sensor domain-containing protein/signal transduction histidine kinase